MKESQEIIDKLSTGYSTQSKTTNAFWLVLIISSIVALVGRKDDCNLIELPFTLGKVVPNDFYTISLILISVIIIVFSAAMTQLLRTRMLIQKAINGLLETDRFIGKIHIQDYFDSIVSSNYTRVAPISQFMLGKNQFFGTGQQNKFVKFLATILYIILKVTVSGFLYLIPAFALKKCCTNLKVNSQDSTIHIDENLLIFMMVLAGISMFILLVCDVTSIIRVTRKLMK